MSATTPSGSAGLGRSVVVVCTANRCRSPMAHGLIRHLAAADPRAATLQVRSAGTWATEGHPPTDDAVTAMAERGIDISDVRSEEIRAETLNQADLVLVMTASHKESLLSEFPEAAEKVMLLSELGDGSWDIADPIGLPLERYRATADEIEALLRSGWERVVGSAPQSPPPVGTETS